MRLLVWLVLSIAFTATAQAAGCEKMTRFSAGALLIGVSRSDHPESPKPVGSAEQDVARLEGLLLKKLPPEISKSFKVFTLVNGQAKTAAVLNCLDAMANNVERGGMILVFASVRGFSSELIKDGYILTADADIAKLPKETSRPQRREDNGVSLSTLSDKLAAMGSTVDRYLFLDLCRDPVETPGIDNLINKRVLDENRFLKFAGTRQVVLASSGTKRSVDGVYGTSIEEVARLGQSLDSLFQELKASVGKKSGNKQEPARPGGKANDGWDRILFKKMASVRGPLVASLAPVFFENTMQESAAEGMDEAATAEEAAQQVFSRYGEGNHFAGDPLDVCRNSDPAFAGVRLCKEEYRAAAAGFDRAADLRESSRDVPKDAAGHRALIVSLRERARFCRAQAHLLDGHADLAKRELGEANSLMLAESHNILGIANLELGEFAEAERLFRLSKEEAPHWPYPRHNLALALIEHGNYAAAEREYREAIVVTPVGETRVSDARSPCFHGRKVAVKSRPYLYYNLAVLLQRLNRLEEAQRQYCLAQESFLSQVDLFGATPGGSPDAVRLGGHFARAARMNLTDVYNSLGVLLASRGKRDKAEEWLRKAADENLPAAQQNLAKLREARTSKK